MTHRLCVFFLVMTDVNSPCDSLILRQLSIAVFLLVDQGKGEFCQIVLMIGDLFLVWQSESLGYSCQNSWAWTCQKRSKIKRYVERCKSCQHIFNDATYSCSIMCPLGAILYSW